MTIIKPLSDGTECLQMTLSDGQDEVRVHLHDSSYGPEDEIWLVGLMVKNASRGLLYDDGDVVGLECQE